MSNNEYRTLKSWKDTAENPECVDIVRLSWPARLPWQSYEPSFHVSCSESGWASRAGVACGAPARFHTPCLFPRSSRGISWRRATVGMVV
jgi:hypothetical protein